MHLQANAKIKTVVVLERESERYSLLNIWPVPLDTHGATL